jgi:hypothetical protein
VTIQEENLPENILARIEDYLAEAAYLLVHVLDAPDRYLEDFDAWARHELMSNRWSPWLLHDHPIELAKIFMGIDSDDDLRQQVVMDKLQELMKTEAYTSMSAQGWRTCFGMSNLPKL